MIRGAALMRNVNDHAYWYMSEPLSRKTLNTILSDISKLKIGVIGDACVDIYWYANMTQSELSRETPHHSLPVVQEFFSPGAAGNVAINLKALGCQEVSICLLIGSDWKRRMICITWRVRHCKPSNCWTFIQKVWRCFAEWVSQRSWIEAEISL